MAISSALSFLSDRKRPIVVAVTLFILLSPLFLLFGPAPSALPFFSSSSSSSSHHLSSASPTTASAPSQTAIPVPADASPPETPPTPRRTGSVTAPPTHLGQAPPPLSVM